MRDADRTLTVTMLLALAAGLALPLAAQAEDSLGELRGVDKDQRQAVMQAGEVQGIDTPSAT